MAIQNQVLSEKSKPDPISEYAKSSLKVEQELLSDLCVKNIVSIVKTDSFGLSQDEIRSSCKFNDIKHL